MIGSDHQPDHVRHDDADKRNRTAKRDRCPGEDRRAHQRQTLRAADVHAAWRELLGDRASVLTRDEAMGRGWFGEVDSEVLPRIGDVVAAAHENHVMLSSVDFPYEMRLIGMHGSLTPVEMLVPVLVA